MKLRAAVGQWKGLFDRGCRAYKAHARDKKTREPLQLILAALIYQGRALRGFKEDSFHRRIKDEQPVIATMADVAGGSLSPLADSHYVAATMHLASAAIRLPTAIHQLAKALPRPANADPRKDFQGLHVATDWQRKIGCRYFGEVERLGHCSQGLNPAIAIVAMLLFRDEFGHGEEGDSTDHWRLDRPATMQTLHFCSVVDIQQLLAQWAFDRLP